MGKFIETHTKPFDYSEFITEETKNLFCDSVAFNFELLLMQAFKDIQEIKKALECDENIPEQVMNKPYKVVAILTPAGEPVAFSRYLGEAWALARQVTGYTQNELVDRCFTVSHGKWVVDD